MKQYELTYLTAEEGDEGIPAQITELGGRLINTGSLGRRKLAYPIKKSDFAVYHSILFTADPTQVEKLKGDLAHSQKIFRSLLFERKVEALPTVEFDEKLAQAKEEELPPQAIAEIVESEEKEEKPEKKKKAVKPTVRAAKKPIAVTKKPKAVRPVKKAIKPHQVELEEKLKELLKE